MSQTTSASKFEKYLSIAVNLTILLVSLVFLYVLVVKVVLPSPEHRASAPKTGESLHLDEIVSLRPNLVFAVSTTCHYCTASAPFYIKLIDEARRHGVNTVAVFPQPVNEARSYLRLNGWAAVDSVVSLNISFLKVNSTPTLILVDRNGKVSQSWIGQLNPAKEEEVLRQVSK